MCFLKMSEASDCATALCSITEERAREKLYTENIVQKEHKDAFGRTHMVKEHQWTFTFRVEIPKISTKEPIHVRVYVTWTVDESKRMPLILNDDELCTILHGNMEVDVRGSICQMLREKMSKCAFSLKQVRDSDLRQCRLWLNIEGKTSWGEFPINGEPFVPFS